jgi:putative hydrolase of the HAD superfamily
MPDMPNADPSQPVGPLAGIQGVIFDLDDTLFDHRGAVEVALTAWLPTLGIPADDTARGLWHQLEERHWARLRAGMATFTGQRRARVHEFLTTTTSAASAPRDNARLDALFAEYLAAYRTGWRAFPDARPTVDGLRANGIGVAVLTNGHHDEQAAKLVAIGLGDLAPHLISADRIGVTKPDPRAYRAAVERCGIPAPQLLHVGDRPDLDVSAPRDIGMRAVLVDRVGAFPTHPDRITNLQHLLLGSPATTH